MFLWRMHPTGMGAAAWRLGLKRRSGPRGGPACARAAVNMGAALCRLPGRPRTRRSTQCLRCARPHSSCAGDPAPGCHAAQLLCPEHGHVPLEACPFGRRRSPHAGPACACAAVNVGAPVCGLLRRPALWRTARWWSSRESPAATSPPHGCRKPASVRVPPRPTPLCL